MPTTLNDIERRVLGVLLEKSLAQPQYYPMTVNAIIAACNQKSNRDPLMELDDEAVWNTLEVLRAGGVVARLLPGEGGRVERFKHEAKESFGWEKPQRAIMAELLLRGPQTIGELRSRCARMYPFESPEMVQGALEPLTTGDSPYVAPLPRQPGRSAVRYAHCLYAPDEWATLTRDASPTAPPPPTAASSATSPAAQPVGEQAELEALREDITNLQAEIADVHESLAQLRTRVQRLEE